MSWGVATQNGVSVSLASIVSLSCGATEFSPASLFTSGVAGAWYDPSDTSTLFQDSAGTTPVTAVEQPVGLMLDKSQGLAASAELVPDYDFATPASWTPETADWVVSGGKATYTKPGAGVQYLQSNDNISIVSGTWYKVTYTISGIAASNNAIFGLFNKTASTNYLGGYQTITANGTYSIYFLATSSTTGIRIYGNAGSTSASWSFESFGIKSIAGNHASQATAASRPVLRARYNLLTYSEQFDNAAWSKPNATITANAAVAPDGTTTADLVTATNAADATCNQTALGVNAAGRVLTFTFYARCASGTVTLPVLGDDGTGKFWSNPSTNKVTVTTAWQQFTVTGTAPALSAANARAGFGGFTTWTTGDAVYIWGADLRTGSSAGTYQRIAAATDYATAGFLPYLYFVTDDSFGTNSIDFTATDKMAVVAGMTKLSDASVSIPFELSANHVANAGSFALYASASALPNYEFRMTSTANAYRTATTYTAPITNVLSCAYDIAQSTVATEIVPKVNGATPTLVDSGSAGTGNFGNYPLFIGRRNNATFPFNGNLYQLIVCGKTLSASELASTEAYVNSKTGAY